MVSDDVVAATARDYRVVGPSASIYFFMVARWVPNSRSIARSDIPLGRACCPQKIIQAPSGSCRVRPPCPCSTSWRLTGMGKIQGMRVGGRAEGEDATAIRHGEIPSLPVDSGEERPAVDEDQEELRAGAGDSGLMLHHPDEPIPGTPPGDTAGDHPQGRDRRGHRQDRIRGIQLSASGKPRRRTNGGCVCLRCMRSTHEIEEQISP